ncbi:hypothetical protein EOL94_03200 [bacterium]|nr:hypothetical protein [bacterium]
MFKIIEKSKKIFFVLILNIFLFQSIPAFAQIDKAFDDSGDSAFATFSESSDVYQNTQSIDSIIYSGLNLLFSILGVVFLILIIFGGAKWMISRGNQDDVRKAKDVLISSIIGLLIVLAAYALTWFIFNFFVQTGQTVDI